MAAPEFALMTMTRPDNVVGPVDDRGILSPTVTRRRHRTRWVAGVAIVVLLACGLAAGFAYWRMHAAPGQLVGGAIAKGNPPAPDFTLTDQFGASDALSSFKGRPVALTFLYTNCPDVCPLIASNLHQTYKQLGNQAAEVGLVAVTVDPEHDSVDKVRQYSEQRGLTNQWLFLVGTRDQLAPVWRAYGITAQPDQPVAKPVSPAEQRAEQGVDPLPQDVEHSAPIFLIDKRGALRAMLPVDATPDTLTTDLRVLVAES
jgi:protein SCO1